MRLAWSCLVTSLLVGTVVGCGSKTGLTIPEYERDAGAFDAGRDAGRDAGPHDAGSDAGEPPDICIELPYLEPPREVRVSFDGRISAADVYFLIDTTGSMSEEIAAIQRTLQTTIIPGLAESIPDVRFSVGSLADFPETGADRDKPFVLVQPSTGDIGAVQAAVDRLPMSSGGDGPESQVEALYLSATGEAFGIYVPPPGCPEGTVGYPCFRRDGSRIFLLFTDWSFHNGPGGAEPYPLSIRPAPHSYAEAVNALRAIGAKVLGIYSGSGDGFSDMQTIARDTGAVGPRGEPLVFNIGTDASGLDRQVIEAVRTLVDDVPIDIDLLVEDVPGDPLDATTFVRRVLALSAEPPDGATNLGDRFADVRPGTRVTFSVELQNELIPPSPLEQRYRMRIVLRGDGVTRLTETVVEVVIPGMMGGGCEMP